MIRIYVWNVVLSLNLIARMSLLRCVSLLKPIDEIMINVCNYCSMQYNLGHLYVCMFQRQFNVWHAENVEFEHA